MAENPDAQRFSMIQTIGRRLLELATFIGSWLGFVGSSLALSLRHGLPLRLVVAQVYEIGYRALPLTAISALAVGMVMALQMMFLLKKFGVMQYVAVGVGLSVTRELGPVITALMVAGRSGSGITAELGSMKVTRQIDALRVLAVDPERYLVGTRIVACMIALPLLAAISDFLGIFGGALIGTTLGGVSPEAYLQTTLYFVTLSDVLTGLAKTVFFGLLISGTAAYYGFHTEGGTSGVGRATTTTVVVSSLMIFLSDVFMTQILVTVGY